MKLLSLLTALSFIFITTWGQSQQEQLHRLADNIIAHQYKQYAASKTTGMTQRLVMTQGLTPPQTYDTTTLVYSGIRGSEFNFTYMWFDWSYNPDAPVRYPYSNDRISTMPDTVIDRYTASSPMFTSERKNYYAYDNNNNITGGQIYQKQGSSPSSMVYMASSDLNTYSAGGLMSSHLGLLRSNGLQPVTTLDTVSKANYYYDAQGRVIMDSVFSYISYAWQPHYIMRYNYSPAGNLDTIVQLNHNGSQWQEEERHTMEYYSGNLLKTIKVVNTTLTAQTKDSFGYNASNIVTYMFTTSSVDGGITWSPQAFRYKHISASGMPDTVYLGSYPAPAYLKDTSVVQVWGFNTYNNPVTEIDYNYPAYTVNTQSNYFYEEYANSIKEPRQTINAKLYPNPARNAIYIQSGTTYKQATVHLYNTLGSCIGSYSFTNNEPMKLQLGSYAAGLYYYRVMYDGVGVGEGKFVVER